MNGKSPRGNTAPEALPTRLRGRAAQCQPREQGRGPGSLLRRDLSPVGCPPAAGGPFPAGGPASTRGSLAPRTSESRARNFPAVGAAFALKCLAVNKRSGSNNTAVPQSERRLPLHLASATHAVSVLIPAPKGTCNYEPPSSPPAHILLFETFTEEGYLDCE